MMAGAPVRGMTDTASFARLILPSKGLRVRVDAEGSQVPSAKECDAR